jgi:hypothetical protein
MVLIQTLLDKAMRKNCLVNKVFLKFDAIFYLGRRRQSRGADPDGAGQGHAQGLPRQRSVSPADQADDRSSGAEQSGQPAPLVTAGSGLLHHPTCRQNGNTFSSCLNFFKPMLKFFCGNVI